MEKEITLTIREHTGTALVEWNDNHYEAFITVPYKDARWVDLFTNDLNNALTKAFQELKIALFKCGLC